MLAKLLHARTLIAHGWCQFSYCTQDKTKYCLIGALTEAGASPIPFHNKLHPYTFISAWNDADGRTQEDVLKLIDEVIKELECSTA